jgi:hypothetical protein
MTGAFSKVRTGLLADCRRLAYDAEEEQERFPSHRSLLKNEEDG